MKTETPFKAMWDAFFVVALVSFFLYVGPSVYGMLYPVQYWKAECTTKNSIGQVVSSRTSPRLDDEHQVRNFIKWAANRGEICTVAASRAYFRSMTAKMKKERAARQRVMRVY